MGVRAIVLFFPLVVVNYLDIQWAGLVSRPFKADAPPVVDPYRVLPIAISFQRFQPVRVQCSEIAEGLRGVENPQPFLGLTAERFPLADPLTGGKPLRFSIPAAPYHRSRLSL
jgi:hypothetical protein